MSKFAIGLFLTIIVGLIIFINPFKKEDVESKNTPPVKFIFDKNSKYIYKLDYLSNIIIYLDKDIKSDKYSLESVLNFRVMKHSSDEVIALMQLSDISLKTSNKALNEGLTKLYSQMFIVKLAKDGEILKYYFQYDNSDYKGLMQLVGSMQVIVEDKQLYNRTEHNYDGNIDSKYIRDSHDKFKIEKKRLEYSTYNDEALDMKIVSSNINALVDENWIKDLDLKEKFEVYNDGKKMLSYTNKMKIFKKNSLFESSLDIWKFSGNIDALIKEYSRKDKKSYFKQLQQKMKKQYFSDNGITIKLLLKNLKSGSLKNLIELREYITLYPEEAKYLYDVIKTSEDKLSAALINVLEVSGTPQAQKVLRKIAISDEMNHMGHLRAVISLGGVQNPTNESIDFLWDVYEDKDTGVDKKDIANTSILSIGAASRNSEKKEEINLRLKDEFNSKSDDAYHKKSILLSMQNADANNFIPEIYDALEDDNSVIKATAVKALKGINSDEVKDKMLQNFNMNEDKNVRKKVIKTLKSIEANDALIAQAQINVFKEEDNLIRKDLILYLIQNADKYPGNVDVLKKVKRVELDKNNQILLIKYGI